MEVFFNLGLFGLLDVHRLVYAFRAVLEISYMSRFFSVIEKTRYFSAVSHQTRT